MIKKCEVCGNNFGENLFPSRLKKQKYCSYKCRNKAHENKVERICKQCNKKFYTNKCWTKRGQGKFCSKKCFDKYQTTYPERHCQTCNKLFRACGKNRKFCSLKCAYGHRLIETNKTGKWFICKCCRKRFYVELRHIKKGWKNYCSMQCRKKDSWEPKRIIKKCLNCGKEFTVLKIERDIRHFCSFSCYRKYTGESTPEKLFREALEKEGILFKQEFQVRRYSIDFIVQKIAIEIDGNYWHDKTEVKERDKRKELLLKNKGFTVIRFSESEVKNNLKKCIAKVIKLMSSENRKL